MGEEDREGGLGLSQLGQTHAAMLFNPPGPLSCRAHSQRSESIVPQVALFSFFKTEAEAFNAELILKLAVFTVRPSLTEHPVVVRLQKGISEWGTSYRGALSVTTR